MRASLRAGPALVLGPGGSMSHRASRKLATDMIHRMAIRWLVPVSTSLARIASVSQSCRSVASVGERAVFQSVAEWKRMLAERRMTCLEIRPGGFDVTATADASERHQYASTIVPLCASNARQLAAVCRLERDAELAPRLPRLELLELPPPQKVRPDELGERGRPEFGIGDIRRRPSDEHISAGGRRDDVAGAGAVLHMCRERFVRHAAQNRSAGPSPARRQILIVSRQFVSGITTWKRLSDADGFADEDDCRPRGVPIRAR